MKRLILFWAVTLAASSLHALTCVWTNTAGGSWQVTNNWSPHSVPGAGDVAMVTNLGTYTVVMTNNVTVNALMAGGPGSPSLVLDNYATLACSNCVIQAGGTMIWSNSQMSGALTIQAGGQLLCAAPSGIQMYSLTITNQGTVTWSSGSMSIGGTQVYNSGLWQITGNNSMSYGGYAWPVWVNTGTLRKVAGAGTSSLGAFNFFNQPGALVDALAGTLTFNGGTNYLLAGAFTSLSPATINLMNGVWTDAGGTFSGTGTNLFSSGIFNFRTNTPLGLKFTGGDLYITGTNTFQQAGTITNLTLDGPTLHGTNVVGAGTLTFSNGQILDQLTILPAGQLVVGGPANKLIYNLKLSNQGTVVCGGSLNMGGAVIANGGLWQITGDYSLNNGSSVLPIWTNSGTLRKTGGGGVSLVDANFVNLPGALVEALTGNLTLTGGTNGQFGGTFNAASFIDLNSGIWTDAGGIATGAGASRFVAGTLNLRTNVPPKLLLMGGNVFITGTNTFQNSGAITNLTLDGATLAGTNSVSGALTMNAGALTGQLTVAPGAQLTFATTASKFLSVFTLLNRGTVSVNGTSVSAGNTTINNNGLWQLTGNYGVNYGGSGSVPIFTNRGTFQKTSGSGLADNTGMNFYHQPGALVQVDAGVLQLPAGSTNFSGTLRLNGGTLNANGTFSVAGGTLDGAGTFGANAFTGGNLSPGVSGAGAMNFSAGLNLNANVTLIMDGTGMVPGTSYDQLSVTGAVAIGNCTLQVTALPAVAAGAVFTIIDNDSTDAVIGTFGGLAENAVLPAGNQLFRISYHGGTGNDVTLTRIANTNALSHFSSVTHLGSGNIQLAATGTAGLTYTMQANTNLTTTNWINLGPVTADALGNLSCTDVAATNYPIRFYRCVWP